MQQFYLKRMTKQDITKSVAICTESVESFWDISLSATDEYTTIEMCHVSNPIYSPSGITIHKGYGGEKDWRICGADWKKLYSDDNPEIGDIMLVRKLEYRRFSVEIIKKDSPNYEFLSALFSGNDNYVMLTTDNSDKSNLFNIDLPLQQIFYGAPGTGKSNTIKREVDDKGKACIRTTFHPDSDYSTFVGAYKPTSIVVPVTTIIGKEQVLVPNAQPEKKIVYEYVGQAFFQAYVEAWKNYAAAGDETPKEQYLVIEEINRGNCAQIFGDLFQLLDRNDSGFSDYPIKADTDLKKQLAEAFCGLEIAQKDKINALYKDKKDVVAGVLNGDILLLPNNLYIWATMNTSDQSLFPIDSAFKRRWDWQYMPISEGTDSNGNKLKWKIEANGLWYDWWDFLNAINSQIEQATNSEDKKLGYFFCKAKNGIIDAKTFVSKVVFYLWNDVFKDFADETGDLFKDSDGSHLAFNKFYDVDDNGTPVMDAKVEQFLSTLKIEGVKKNDVIDDNGIVGDEEDDDGNVPSSRNRDYAKFSVNGIGEFGKNRLATECVRKFIELNPNMPIEEVLDKWKSLGKIVPHFVESKEEYDARTDAYKRSYAIPCGNSEIYVSHDGYGSTGKVFVLIGAVNSQDWGIKLAKVE